jgi:hypothetical protein
MITIYIYNHDDGVIICVKITGGGKILSTDLSDEFINEEYNAMMTTWGWGGDGELPGA